MLARLLGGEAMLLEESIREKDFEVWSGRGRWVGAFSDAIIKPDKWNHIF